MIAEVSGERVDVSLRHMLLLLFRQSLPNFGHVFRACAFGHIGCKLVDVFVLFFTEYLLILDIHALLHILLQ